MAAARKPRSTPELHERAAATKASAEKVMRRAAQNPPPDLASAEVSGTDPVLAAIEAHRQADADMLALQGRVAGRPMSPREFELERRLGQAQEAAADRLLTMTPTSLEGLHAYVCEMRRYLADRRHADGSLDSDWLNHAFTSLACAAEAVATRFIHSSAVPRLDLADMTIRQLAGLLDCFRRAVDSYGMMTFLTITGDKGRTLLNDECEHLDLLCEVVRSELRARKPQTAWEAGLQARALIRELTEADEWEDAAAMATRAAVEMSRMQGAA
ncbi:hypothetical protein [uncultured Methylobacterium sp.]|uniref:hypothetical protein n=1 Tax=uncultured Methylobacterium sp. TaxID=157278 RepID=UPI002594B8D2|nr:hypothetical protein [uncultured Methylobacterium sp.]